MDFTQDLSQYDLTDPNKVMKFSEGCLVKYVGTVAEVKQARQLSDGTWEYTIVPFTGKKKKIRHIGQKYLTLYLASWEYQPIESYAIAKYKRQKRQAFFFSILMVILLVVMSVALANFTQPLLQAYVNSQ